MDRFGSGHPPTQETAGSARDTSILETGKINAERRASMKTMKRMIGLTALILILAGVGCATLPPKTTLTMANQVVLQGKWEGWVNFASGQMGNMVLEITNNAAPFKGNIALSNLPRGAGMFPGNFRNDDTYAGPFENGMLTDTGNFIISGQAGNFGEFQVMGQNNLSGWFYLWGTKGTITLKKK
jgi:hypothetical protein